MRKLNKKGFTLIELLAVIVIMGILMVVAIPAVTRTIENSRRDTFINTTKEYLNSVRNQWLAGNIECSVGGVDKNAAALPTGEYYIPIVTEAWTADPLAKTEFVNSTTYLMESGGKSPFSNGNLYGYVHASKTVDPTTGDSKVEYKVAMVDEAGNGFTTEYEPDQLKRNRFSNDNQIATINTALTGKTLCQYS